MQTLLWIAAMVLAALGFVALVRRLPPAETIVGFLLLAPIALGLRSTGEDQASLFSMVKLASVAAGAAYVLALKITRWSERPLGRAVAYAILAANILEAVVAEAAQGGLVNAAAGVLLVLTQASPGTIHVAPREGWREVRYPLGGLWVAAYVLWNFTFVYGRESHGVTGAFAAFAVIHLLAPLLAMQGDSARFIEARAVSLTLMVVVRVVAPYPPFVILSPGWYVPAVASVLRIASLMLAGYVAARALAGARRTGVAVDLLGRAALGWR